MNSFVRHISEFPLEPTVSNQALRELWRTEGSSIAYLSIRPNESYYLHKHQTFSELYVIIKGSGRVQLSEEWHFVREGHVVLIPSGIVHNIENSGDDDLVFLTISSPAFNAEDTIKIH